MLVNTGFAGVLLLSAGCEMSGHLGQLVKDTLIRCGELPHKLNNIALHLVEEAVGSWLDVMRACA